MSENVRVGDWWFRGIQIRITCQRCGRVRYLRGGDLLNLKIATEDTYLREDDLRWEELRTRLHCAADGCGGRMPKLELGVFR
ncbi:MAG: hypothetical protein J0I48_19035 [Devosia sp.]|uniref:hypothetical protein n=1 Tax=Devosia sp. 66-22 TaxID=1895753 RepID=UPI00092C7F47|nr:hypothetical protein [Devosia sp. 66-22]MBN9348261.1 hypothetical protein [Devosia sp.]OJX48998.1 MAG: hypothetical protein BGO81_10410 [Devosia sp. 66-22]